MGSCARFAAAVCAMLPLALADLPVHCLRHQVVGDWEFTLGPASRSRSSCGHRRPDIVEGQPDLSFVAGQGPTTTRRFSLQDPNIVKAEDGSSGTWTMIYDEAFEVVAGGYTFLAFSRFEFVHDKVKGKVNVSHCDETEVGWYHDHTRGHWGCYFAKKSPTARQPSFLQREARSEVPPVAVGLYHAWVPPSPGYDHPADTEWQTLVTSGLNLLQLGWSAGAPAGRFRGKTPREMNRLVGIRRSVAQHSASKPEPLSFLSISRTHSQRSSTPSALDWRHRDDKNWLEPVIAQGDCGSCYTIATIHMLTARNRIRKKDPHAERFSVMFPLYCSEYNQACDGGYGFLQSKWSEDVGLVPEHCAPFTDATSHCKIAKQCDLGHVRYRATNHRYIGGYYGATREEAMKQELLARGPFVVSFEPTEDFMYYKSGVYSSGRNLHREWEQVDHAVLLVGYGEEPGRRPFWTMQNSWGDDWGEAGFFRMARGQDESGVESIAVAAEVVEEPSNDVLDTFIASL